MTARDRFADWDAAYVLGALSPADRHEFEAHLATCTACRAAVSELAGMPGLLAQVPAAEALNSPDAAPLDLSPGPVPRSRRRTLLAAAALVLAVLIGGVGGFVLRGVMPGEESAPTAPTIASFRAAFQPVIPSAMTAVVDVVPMGTQTELRVECQYAKTSGQGGAGIDYGIYVVDDTGQVTQIKTWFAEPNKVMRPSGVADLPLANIVAVELWALPSNTIVMRAQI